MFDFIFDSFYNTISLSASQVREIVYNKFIRFNVEFSDIFNVEHVFRENVNEKILIFIMNLIDSFQVFIFEKNTSIFDIISNFFNSMNEIVFIETHQHIRQVIQMLKNEHNFQNKQNQVFFTVFQSRTIQKCVDDFQHALIKVEQIFICANCERVMFKNVLINVRSNDYKIAQFQKILNSCEFINDYYQFCKNCQFAFCKQNFFKFEFSNNVNIIFCQKYLSKFSNLIIVKKTMIVRYHFYEIVLKFRRFDKNEYDNLRDHMIVFFSEFNFFVYNFFFSIWKLQIIIKIVWIDANKSRSRNLTFHFMMRRNKILNALKYLKMFNSLYDEIAINHQIIKCWFSIFVFEQLIQNVLHLIDFDHNECQKYAHDFFAKNLKNEHQNAIFDTLSSKISEFLTNSLITNIENEKTQLKMRNLQIMQVVLFQHENNDKFSNKIKSTFENNVKISNHFISFEIQKRISLINHWSNVFYFVAVFSTLFSRELNDHADDRNEKISIETFAKWVLTHYSRK